MKRILYIIPIIFLMACLFNQRKKDDLPSFNLLLLDSTTVFNTKDIPEGKPSIILFFSPDCEHCQAETESILKNMDSLKNVQFYLVSIDPLDRMKAFNGYYKLFRYPNITIGRDYSISFPAYYKGVVPPYSVIYDRHKKLEAVFKGQMNSSQLIAIVNKL